MCRFIIAKSKKEFNPKSLLEKFSKMCEKSRTLDGDRQSDGFGVAWIENQEWETYKSLDPIWEERKYLENIPDTRLIVGHARSATFKHKTGKVEYNQPYININDLFVFNGHLQGVSLQVDGEIGAQKIWNLINKLSKRRLTYQTLERFHELIHDNTNKIIGMNIGVVTKDDIFIISESSNLEDYFTLKKANLGDKLIICSEEIEGIKFENLSRDKVLHYN